MDASQFSIADNFTTIKVSGMTCNHCVANIENSLKKLDNIELVKGDLESQTIQITGYDIDLVKVKQTVEDLGYGFETNI
ncbi:MAG: heavy-metal-associated domain-containing protein [Bacteroidales bacterium]|nr:heavy-metal-associated domain-containing protein [Bacteroidales bacterium]